MVMVNVFNSCMQSLNRDDMSSKPQFWHFIINSKVTSFPLADLLPEELGGFYWYNGSLTEPQHCPEVVQVRIYILLLRSGFSANVEY